MFVPSLYTTDQCLWIEHIYQRISIKFALIHLIFNPFNIIVETCVICYLHFIRDVSQKAGNVFSHDGKATTSQQFMSLWQG